MSADNWRTCPRCKAIAKKNAQRRLDEAMAQYGQVPYEEFKAALDAAEALGDRPLDNSFREDYEIGVWDEENSDFDKPTLYISYKGRCGNCGLEVKFEDEDPVTWEGQA